MRQVIPSTSWRTHQLTGQGCTLDPHKGCAPVPCSGTSKHHYFHNVSSPLPRIFQNPHGDFWKNILLPFFAVLPSLLPVMLSCATYITSSADALILFSEKSWRFIPVQTVILFSKFCLNWYQNTTFFASVPYIQKGVIRLPFYRFPRFWISTFSTRHPHQKRYIFNILCDKMSVYFTKKDVLLWM